MRRHLLVAAAVLIWASVVMTRSAEAQQFRTPDRQFHNETSFPLDGRHRTVDCESCHVKGVYKGTPTRCYDCHWVRRQDDRYRLQLGSQCEQCHRPTSWTDVRWNHGAMTQMPLNGAHRQLTCVSCHKDNAYRKADVNCVTCHQQAYLAAREPNHVAAGFPTTCESCHRASDTSFRGVRFDHASVFPLAGVHAQQACATCHVNGLYRGTPRTCIGCHQSDFNRTTAPNHAAAGFSSDCEGCHRNTDPAWRGGTTGFNHAAVFPLVGLHAQQVCAACHVNGVFKGTPRTCVGCHQPDYSRTTAPNHAAAGFSTDCESCHRNTDTSWRTGNGGFKHAAVFPLQGIHAQQVCAACHANGVFKGTPRTCVGCHQMNFNRTTSPNHITAGFPTTCDSCHRATDTRWQQATFTHRFPITSGNHRTACATCHVSSSNFQTFTCLTCHAHSQSQMDSKHRGRTGYRYDSLACYACHPNGRH